MLGELMLPFFQRMEGNSCYATNHPLEAGAVNRDGTTFPAALTRVPFAQQAAHFAFGCHKME